MLPSSPSRRVPLALVAALAACADLPEPEPAVELAAAERSEVTLVVVDAAARAFADDAVRVRWMVRTPVTLDAAGVEEVAPGDPLSLAHEVSSDSLVVEVRVEAPSYGRVDTVLAASRGEAAEPLMLALARHGEVATVAAAEPRSGQGPPPPASAPPPRTEPDRRAGSPGGARPGRPAAPPAGDPAAIREGDEAFRRGDWAAAAAAYARMPPPTRRDGPAAQVYQRALVRKGIAHSSLGQLPEALSTLEEAVAFDLREYTAYFYLGQTQCALGRVAEGRASLDRVVTGLEWTISEAQRPVVVALARYQLAMCSVGEHQRVGSAATRDRAVADLRAFIEGARGLSPVPAQVQPALDDAQQRLRALGG